MFTNPFDKEDSITESSLFYAVFPAPLVFLYFLHLSVPLFFIQRQVRPGQLFFNLFT